jgi:hypothetical protein
MEGHKLLGMRVLGDASTPAAGKGVELVFDSNVSLMECPMSSSEEASETMRGVLGGAFDARYMKRMTVNRLPAVGWNPVDDRTPGGRSIGYSGLAWLTADGKTLYTVFGGTTLTVDQLKAMAESLN